MVMALFGFKKKSSPASVSPASPAAPDFCSPLWSDVHRVESMRRPVTRREPRRPSVEPPPVLVCLPETPSEESATDAGEHGAMRQVVLRLTIPSEWLDDMELDPQVELLLACIDDTTTIGELLGEGMRREETMNELFELLENGVLEARLRMPFADGSPRVPRARQLR